MTDYFELGRVLKPQGIRGEVKAELYTDDPNRVLELEKVYFALPGGYSEAVVTQARTDGRFAYLRFAGVSDRDAAEPLRGSVFYIDRQHAAPLPDGAYYIRDLVGLPVFTGDEKIGVLRDVLQTGTKDIYVTELEGGGQLMFPAVQDVFVARDVEGGRIVLNPERLKEVGIYDL